MENEKREKIILDCDPGMDDSAAIIMAAKSSRIELLAVTTVSGNYPVEVTSENALKVLEMLKIDRIPVAAGMAHPMTRPRPRDPFTHGRDGQAENNLPAPSLKLCGEHAVDLIIKTVLENPNEVTIVCTGPLSNVGMALTKAPEVIPLIKRIVAISGMFGLNESAYLNATGDTPQSEWNVYVDPEAADIVYRSGTDFYAIGLDVATNSSVDFTPEDLEAFHTSARPEAVFLDQAIRFTHNRGFDAYCAVIDCMAVSFVIDPTLAEWKKFHVGVETKDGLTLGMTIRDGRHHFVWEDLPLINVAVTADYTRTLKLIRDLILQ